MLLRPFSADELAGLRTPLRRRVLGGVGTVLLLALAYCYSRSGSEFRRRRRVGGWSRASTAARPLEPLAEVQKRRVPGRRERRSRAHDRRRALELPDGERDLQLARRRRRRDDLFRLRRQDLLCAKPGRYPRLDHSVRRAHRLGGAPRQRRAPLLWLRRLEAARRSTRRPGPWCGR